MRRRRLSWVFQAVKIEIWRANGAIWNGIASIPGIAWPAWGNCRRDRSIWPLPIRRSTSATTTTSTTTAADAEQYLDWTRRWGEAVHRVLKPDGTFWLAIGDEYAAELKLHLPERAGLHLPQLGGLVLHVRRQLHEEVQPQPRPPVPLRQGPEAVHVQRRGDPRAVGPAARLRRRRADPRGRLPDDTWILRPQDLPEGFQPDEDTWYFTAVCGTFKERAGWHGCQMPEQLLGRIIRVCSNPGDVVLDPFAGSGTTLAVAKKLGRRWVGFELSPNYAKKTQARLDAAEVGQKLEGAEEPKVGAGDAGEKRETEASVL